MKQHTPNPIRGWLPQEPYIPSYLQTTNLVKTRRRSTVKMTVGLVLLLVGLGVIAASFASVSRTQAIFDDSFVLAPSQTASPYSAASYSGNGNPWATTPVFSGKIFIQDQNIEFTTISTDEQREKNVVINTSVNQEYEFNIPINHEYSFTLRNPSSNHQSTVRFTLKQTWTDLSLLIPGSIALLATAIPGTTLLLIGLHGKNKPEKKAATMDLKIQFSDCIQRRYHEGYFPSFSVSRKVSTMKLVSAQCQPLFSAKSSPNSFLRRLFILRILRLI
jgi:hypothetical protein